MKKNVFLKLTKFLRFSKMLCISFWYSFSILSSLIFKCHISIDECGTEGVSFISQLDFSLDFDGGGECKNFCLDKIYRSMTLFIGFLSANTG